MALTEAEYEKVASLRYTNNEGTNEYSNINEEIYNNIPDGEVIEDLNHRITELELKIRSFHKWGEWVQKKMKFLEASAPKTSNNGTRWSFEEEQFLLNNYTEFGPTELAEMWEEEFDKSRTEKSISSKASKIKVKYGLSVQDKRDITKILEGSGVIHKKKAIELANELGVNLLKLVEYLQWTHKVGSEEDGSYNTDLKDQWNL